MRPKHALWLLPLLLLVPFALLAAPEDDYAKKLREVEDLMRRLAEAKAAADAPEIDFGPEEKRVLRIVNVADLTVRLPYHIHPRLELLSAGSSVDESQPMFGTAWEGERFFGGAEELMDLIFTNVRPEVWEEGRASIDTSGPYGLVVIAEPDVQAAVLAYVDELRQNVGRIVTISIRVLRAASAGALPRGSLTLGRAEGLALLAKAEAGDGLTVAHSARITGFSGQRVAFHRGGQRSFVQDYDVEVAQESSISDPIVGVVQSGLSFDCRALTRGEGLVMLDLRAEMNTLTEPLRTVISGSGPVQAPECEFVNLSTTVTIPRDGFALLGSGGGGATEPWALLVSAAVEKIGSGGKGGAR